MITISAYDLKSFYRDLKGRIIRSIIRNKILELWPDDDIKNDNIVGYGYALPYLEPYRSEEARNRVTSMHPVQLGVHHWPEDGKNITVLHTEQLLPLETNSVDRILMIHGVEFLDNPQETFQEIWRVLKSTGRLLIVVPNRLGFWARADWSPLGQGQPYSAGQVETLLKNNLFVHERTCQALFTPAFQKDMFLRTAHIFEKVGAVLCPALGGVHVIEASKQIYATRNKGTGVPVGVVPASRPVKAKTITNSRNLD